MRENPLFYENSQLYKWLYLFFGSIFLPFNFNSPMHFLASIEILIIDILILYIIINHKKYKYFKFSIIYFMINIIFFGYTVLNVGTYTRYRTEYLIVFLMLIYTNSNNDKYNTACA